MCLASASPASASTPSLSGDTHSNSNSNNNPPSRLRLRPRAGELTDKGRNHGQAGVPSDPSIPQNHFPPTVGSGAPDPHPGLKSSSSCALVHATVTATGADPGGSPTRPLALNNTSHVTGFKSGKPHSVSWGGVEKADYPPTHPHDTLTDGEIGGGDEGSRLLSVANTRSNDSGSNGSGNNSNGSGSTNSNPPVLCFTGFKNNKPGFTALYLEELTRYRLLYS